MKIKNSEVIDAFIEGLEAQGSNLKSTGDKLINYNTCIAQWYGDVVILNITYYSITTSKHQNMIKRNDDIIKVLVNTVPEGEMNLINYINQSKLYE